MKHPSGMLIQSDGSKPYVVRVMERLADAFPYIIFKMGGFKDRNVHGTNTKSLHASGRAIDTYLDVSYGHEKALGELLYEMYKSNAATLKTNHVIFNWKEWAPGDTADRIIGEHDERGPHTDHVHVDFVDDGMDTASDAILPFLADVAKRFRDAGYGSWMDGMHGPAFYPAPHKNGIHLTRDQRKAIWLLNMGIALSDAGPKFAEVMKQMEALGDKVLVRKPGKTWTFKSSQYGG